MTLTTLMQTYVFVLAAFVATGGSVPQAAARVGVRLSTAKRHLADLRARSGLTTEQLIYRGRAEGWLVVPASNLAVGIATQAWTALTRESRATSRPPEACAPAGVVLRSAERTPRG